MLCPLPAMPPPGIRQPDDFDSADLVVFVVSTCVALVGAWRLVQEDEFFLSITSGGLALGFMIVSINVARSRNRTAFTRSYYV